MAIYRLWPNSKFADLTGASEEDSRKLRWYDPLLGDPLPSVEDWVPPRLVQYLGGGNRNRKPRILGDFPPCSSLTIVSANAVESLGDVITSNADLYPVNVDGAESPYFMLVATTVIDALDRDASVGIHWPRGHTEHFLSLEEWVFNEKELGGALLFRLPDSQTDIFVSDEFRARVIGAKLKGVCFKRSMREPNPSCC